MVSTVNNNDTRRGSIRFPRKAQPAITAFRRISGIGGQIALPILRESVMSLLLILIILLVLLGGGGLYLGGPRTGISLGGLILIVIVIMAVTGRL
jgi:hypothetical protein